MVENPVQKQLSEYEKEIARTLDLWKYQHDNGCNDPTWPDGVNLNLLRNHMFYYKNKIMEICGQNGIDLPGEYYLPIPPYVNPNYFAKPKSDRAIRIIKSFGPCANIETISDKPFNDTQMRLFD